MKRIVFAHECQECECCGEPWCEVHEMHYADCPCLGPQEALDKGYELIEKDGAMWAVKPEKRKARSKAGSQISNK